MTSNRHPRRRHDGVNLRRIAALGRLGPGVFTRAQALAAGLTPSDLRSDAVTPVLHGTYVAGSQREITQPVRCAAALVLAPAGSRVSGISAAALLGLPAPSSERVHLAIPPGTRFRHHDVSSQPLIPRTASTTALVPSISTRIAMTAPSDLLLETWHLPLVDAVVLADAALRRCGGTLNTTLPPFTGNAAARRMLRRISELGDARAESAMESRVRVLLTLAGFEGLVAQHVVEVGTGTRRIDLAFPQWRAAIEYEGFHHFASEAQKQADFHRQEELEALGWSVIRLVARDVYNAPAATVERVAAALRRRGCIVNPSMAWRAHFPQHAGVAA